MNGTLLLLRNYHWCSLGLKRRPSCPAVNNFWNSVELCKFEVHKVHLKLFAVICHIKAQGVRSWVIQTYCNALGFLCLQIPTLWVGKLVQTMCITMRHTRHNSVQGRLMAYAGAIKGYLKHKGATQRVHAKTSVYDEIGENRLANETLDNFITHCAFNWRDNKCINKHQYIFFVYLCITLPLLRLVSV